MNTVVEHNPIWLTKFVNVYENLATDNLDLLLDLYHQDIYFQDPLHELKGLSQLTEYFDGLYENLITCQFNIHSAVCDGTQASLYWTMTFEHPKLAKGVPVEVDGNSLIKGNADKVTYHRDYYDVGAMLYEQLPLLGRVIRHIKTRAAQS
ncbi:MAG: nuclear transport factor 2 family protein [Gammaproteobacteria bacterium]|nr:nuclear transport factor 2 family protein [Gammaproteobacteria bacterium]